jgi:hypothetical protein
MGRDFFRPPGIPPAPGLVPVESPDVAAALETLKNQLLIYLVRRLGGRVVLSADDLAAAGGVLAFRLDPATRRMTFEVQYPQ